MRPPGRRARTGRARTGRTRTGRTRNGRWTAGVAAAVLVLTATGCSAAEEDSGIAEIVREAIEQAREQREQRTGSTSGQDNPQQDPNARIETDARADFDYAEFQRSLSLTIGLLQQFWAAELPELGGEYRDLRGFTYYRSDQGAGPECGGQAAPANNAFYCPAGDFIAWDESGLMIPYYVGGGDFAASFVLAHEFGHAMQVRLPQQETTGVLRELQADCFAGAWARWTSQNNLLEAGDLDEATLAVFAARDVPGTAWTDPRAHGSGFERTRAFGDGFEGGPESCYPAPAEEWVITRE